MKRTALTPYLASFALASAMTASAGAALATEGYFQHGYGARHKALGGAGVADGRDATTAALNPAALVRAPSNELSISVSAFMPHRYYEGSGQAGFTPQGRVESDSTLFFVPNLAWSTKVDPASLFGLVDAIGITVYGNGGMNTNYPAVARPAGQCGAGASSGIFCGGTAGVNLQQAFVSLAFAKQLGSGLSVGVAPILARQQFEAEGLRAFGGASIAGGNLTERGTDVSWGGGIRAGIEWAVTPGVRLGAAGNSRIYMNSFERYSGLFAERGDFDIPASVQAGIAVDLTPRVTAMLDYKHIFYGDIRSIANPSTNLITLPAGGGLLGNDQGTGFGWKDIDVVKFGVEWREALPGTTLRAGYSYNTSPLESRDVMFNILAPATVQHHFTAGAQIALTPKMDLEIAGMYAPEVSISGNELALQGANPNHRIEIGMEQYEVTMGIKYRFGSDPKPLK